MLPLTIMSRKPDLGVKESVWVEGQRVTEQVFNSQCLNLNCKIRVSIITII
jgi:hypothetical protein